MPPENTTPSPIPGLRHISDSVPGLRRIRRGRGYCYVDTEGNCVEDAENLARIRSLVIPPAWHDVWISPRPSTHLQATGRDAKGRKQYLYHENWRSARSLAKFARMIEFGEHLPALRRRVRADLREPALSRGKVLAVAVALLEGLHVRVGNDAYARANGSVGLSTLEKRHVKVRGEMVHFEFVGKSGRACSLDYRAPRVARTLRKCVELPGKRLFHYRTGDGSIETIDSGDINAYLHTHMGDEFTAKDFRTWSGSVLACSRLLTAERPPSRRGRARVLNAAVRDVATALCNTPAVCRKYYIHPAILNEFMEGDLAGRIARRRDRRKWRGLRNEERTLLKLLYAVRDDAPENRRKAKPARGKSA